MLQPPSHVCIDAFSVLGEEAREGPKEGTKEATEVFLLVLRVMVVVVVVMVVTRCQLSGFLCFPSPNQAWHVFLRGGVLTGVHTQEEKSVPKNPLPTTLSDQEWKNCVALQSNLKLFSGLCSHIEKNKNAWHDWIESENMSLCTSPLALENQSSNRTTTTTTTTMEQLLLQSLLLVKTLRSRQAGLLLFTFLFLLCLAWSCLFRLVVM